jgi:hypothetical protein
MGVIAVAFGANNQAILSGWLHGLSVDSASAWFNVNNS